MTFTASLPFWLGFNLLVLALLALDLGLVGRRHALSMRVAALWSAGWVALALGFNGLVWLWFGAEAALEFLAGYLIEYSLSVDNLFVFVVVFASFAVPAAYQHRVLFFGILGALVMRGAMIWLGTALIKEFHWLIYVFGGFLILTGLKLAFHRAGESDPAANPIVRLLRRTLPVTERYHGGRFLTRVDGRLHATPLLLVVLVIEVTDLIFAVDSIPAVLAVTRDPFIVYTSNVFAILGLRSLFFLLAGMVNRFHYLKLGLAGVLTFVGAKMLLSDSYPVPIALSLGVIAGCLGLAVGCSLWRARVQSRRAAGGATNPARMAPADRDVAAL